MPIHFAGSACVVSSVPHVWAAARRARKFEIAPDRVPIRAERLPRPSQPRRRILRADGGAQRFDLGHELRDVREVRAAAHDVRALAKLRADSFLQIRPRVRRHHGRTAFAL
jgi:hypothetical protein